jgi:hypothetical protein
VHLLCIKIKITNVFLVKNLALTVTDQKMEIAEAAAKTTRSYF